MKTNTVTPQKPLRRLPLVYNLEYSIGSSPRILYKFLSTPQGLSQWFADKVDVRNNIFTFFWNDSSRQAELLSMKPFEFIRFRWSDDPEGASFELRIQVDELTNDVALMITDYGFEKSDLTDGKRLWDNLVQTLKHTLGAA